MPAAKTVPFEKVEAKLRAGLLPKSKAKLDAKTNTRGFVGNMVVGFVLDKLLEYLKGRFVFGPKARANAVAERGLDADAIWEGFVDWITQGLSGYWAEIVRDTLIALGPIIIDILRGYTARPADAA